MVDEVLLDVAHQAQGELRREDAGVLSLVFLEDVGLHRAAHLRERGGLDLVVGLARQHLVAGDAEQHQPQGLVARRERPLVGRPRHTAPGVELGDLPVRLVDLALALDPLLAGLVDGGVQEEAEEHWRRAVDGHRHRRGRVGQIEAGVELLGVVDAGDADPRVADLAVDVRTRVGVLAVERHRVEGGGEALGRQPSRDVVEATVGALRAALAGEHARRVLVLALEGEDAGGERELPRRRLAQEPGQHVAPVLVPGQGDLGDAQVRQRLAHQVELDHLVAHLVLVLGGGVALAGRRPLVEQLLVVGAELPLQLAIHGTELAQPVRLALGAGDDLHRVAGTLRLDDVEALLADAFAQGGDAALQLVHAPRHVRWARTSAS